MFLSDYSVQTNPNIHVRGNFNNVCCGGKCHTETIGCTTVVHPTHLDITLTNLMDIV